MYLHTQRARSLFKGEGPLSSLGSHLQKQLARVTHTVSSLLRKEVWRLEASNTAPCGGQTVLFVGNSPEKYYIGKLFFKEDFSCRSLGHFWLWQILFPKGALKDDNSFCVVQTRWPITRFSLFNSWFCLPNWVNGSVDLKADFSKFARKSKATKNALRKIERGNFSVEISSDLASFDEFYYQHHLPYMENRHGNSTAEESYKRVQAKFLEGGEILFVSSGSQRVAGCMLQYKNDGVTAYILGVRDGDFCWVEKGAISALYFHMLNYCRLKGFHKLGMGGSRPFFSDGVLNYKLRSWNMKIDDYLKHFYFLFKPLKMNEFTEAFLCNNSFISLKNKKMVANIFVPKTKNMPGSEEISHLRKKFADKGSIRSGIHYCS